MKYWDGRPVCFVCCERGDGAGPGAVFWAVAFQIVEDDDQVGFEDNSNDVD